MSLTYYAHDVLDEMRTEHQQQLVLLSFFNMVDVDLIHLIHFS